jgi:hypothetical protein
MGGFRADGARDHLGHIRAHRSWSNELLRMGKSTVTLACGEMLCSAPVAGLKELHVNVGVSQLCLEGGHRFAFEGEVARHDASAEAKLVRGMGMYQTSPSTAGAVVKVK